jgi:hypothetical protein
MTGINQSGIETSIIGGDCMRKDVFVFPFDGITGLDGGLHWIEVHLLDNDDVACDASGGGTLRHQEQGRKKHDRHYRQDKFAVLQ